MHKSAALNAVAFAALIAGIAGGSERAAAFNVTNNTNFEACVVGNQGNFFVHVPGNSTNPGWYLNDSITLTAYPFDGYVIMENGQGYVVCNDQLTASCNARPHAAVYLSDITFQPGNVVASQDPKTAWTMFYVLDAPGTYSMGGC